MTRRTNGIPEPAPGFIGRILASIEAERRRQARWRIFWFAGILALSLPLAAVGAADAYAGLSQSGFFQFLSLVPADFSAAAANAQDVAFSLLESLPAFSLALCLAAAGFAIWSLARIAREASILRQSPAC